MRFCYVPYEMTIETISFDAERMPDGLDGLDLAVVRAEPGQRLAPPPGGTVWGRIAYITAVADSAEQCRAMIAAAEAALVVTGTPWTSRSRSPSPWPSDRWQSRSPSGRWSSSRWSSSRWQPPSRCRNRPG